MRNKVNASRVGEAAWRPKMANLEDVGGKWEIIFRKGATGLLAPSSASKD